MKTIEERAKNKPILSIDYYRGYVDGATEQKAIDIDKACEWLKARNVLTDASLEGFRKAMEE